MRIGLRPDVRVRLRVAPLPTKFSEPRIRNLHTTILTKLKKYIVFPVGRDSSVVIVTHYRLDGPGIESNWGARLSAPVQTGPGAHTASCTMSAGSFPGGKVAVAWR